MRLLKDEKRELINAVIAALPVGNYKDKISTRAVELAVEKLPPQAQYLWRNGNRGLLDTKSIYWYDVNARYQGVIASATVPGYADQHESIKEDEVIQSWVASLREEKHQRDMLRAQLQAGTEAIRTVEEFKVAFPALVSYLPAKQQAVVNLPVSTELNATFVSLGLPVPKIVDTAEVSA